jgi:hypothetical protein
MAVYKLVIAAKVREFQVNGDREAVEATYEAAAEKVLSAYAPAGAGPAHEEAD